MAGVNKVILIGNLGKDPEIFTTESGIKRAKFSLATSESYISKEGVKVDETEWHNIVFWRGLAEIAEKYLHKGSKIYVEGKIKTNSYVDKEGNKKSFIDIMGDKLEMLDSKRVGESDIVPPPERKGSTNIDSSNINLSEPGDDLPF